MGRQCHVCSKTRYNNPGVTFHSFPANLEKRKIWFALLGFEKDKTLPKRPCICSDHFNQDDFQYKSNGLKYLKSDACPKLFKVEVFQSSSDVGSDSTIDEMTPKKRTVLQEISLKGLVGSSPSQDSSSDEIIPTKSDDKKLYEKRLTIDHKSAAAIPSADDFDKYICAAGPSRISSKQVKPGSLKMDTYKISPEKDSSFTATASEADKEILKLIEKHPNDASQDIVGADIGFKEKLALVSVPQKRKRHYIGDMSSDDFGTPTKRHSNLLLVKNRVRNQQKKIKSLQTTVRRLKLKMNSINSLLKYLKEQALISETSASAIKASLDGPSLDIFERMLKGPSRQKYDPALRCCVDPCVFLP